MSKIIGRAIVITGGKAVPSASTTAQSGVTYTDGLSGLEPADISLIAQTISNNSQITNTTMAVYYDYKKIHRKISIADQIILLPLAKQVSHSRCMIVLQRPMR